MSSTLPDVQNMRGNFGSACLAGVSNVQIPISVKRVDGSLMSTVATMAANALLPSQQKGVHMSRLSQILHSIQTHTWIGSQLQDTLQALKTVMETEYVQVSIAFPYFYEKVAPVTGHIGVAHVNCEIEAELGGNDFSRSLSVDIPAVTLCPCSKEISDDGAHNQRAVVEISVNYANDDIIWIEELIKLVENCASSTPYPILKREDEKFVTEQAYNNPVFVEDLARAVATELSKDMRITFFTVSVRSYESIHQHDAEAYIASDMFE